MTAAAGRERPNGVPIVPGVWCETLENLGFPRLWDQKTAKNLDNFDKSWGKPLTTGSETL
jgi:hypothetical protein